MAEVVALAVPVPLGVFERESVELRLCVPELVGEFEGEPVASDGVELRLTVEVGVFWRDLVEVGVVVGLEEGVGEGELEGVPEREGVGEPVGEAVRLGVSLMVGLAVVAAGRRGVGVGDREAEREAVLEAVGVGLPVPVRVGVPVPVAVTEADTVEVGVPDTVSVEVVVGVPEDVSVVEELLLTLGVWEAVMEGVGEMGLTEGVGLTVRHCSLSAEAGAPPGQGRQALPATGA